MIWEACYVLFLQANKLLTLFMVPGVNKPLRPGLVMSFVYCRIIWHLGEISFALMKAPPIMGGPSPFGMVLFCGLMTDRRSVGTNTPMCLCSRLGDNETGGVHFL